MSAREWKPGDVAMATFDHGGTGLVFRVVGAPSDWCDMAGVCAPAGQIGSVRPIVVIDPEDRAQVERLRDVLVGAMRDHELSPVRMPSDGELGNAMQAALREFASPTPPKPDEPQGLGAVIEDAEGRWWSRVGGTTDAPWHHGTLGRECWSGIEAVRVLSEGVPT